MKTRSFLLLMCVLLAGDLAWGEADSWTLTNHQGPYRDEPVRLGVEFKKPYDAAKLRVKEDGEPVQYQVEVLEGSPGEVRKGHLWVMTNIDAKQSHEYNVITDAPAGVSLKSDVSCRKSGDTWTLTNGLVTLEVRAEGDGGPVVSLRTKGHPGKRTSSKWMTELELDRVVAEPIGDGPLFAKLRVRYEFKGTEALKHPHAEMTFTIWKNRPHVLIEESHRMAEGDGWWWDLSSGWDVKHGLRRRWFKAPFSSAGGLNEAELKPNDRLGTTLMNLQPRWTQAFDEGWFFGATNGEKVLGALVLRAGKWTWPHENLIQVRVDKSGRTAALFAPTTRGSRYWALIAGPEKLVTVSEQPHPSRKGKTRKVNNLQDLAETLGFRPLDKLTHEYILEWPGLDPGGFRGRNFYNNSMNPTGPIRGEGKRAVREAMQGSFKPSRGNLSYVQVMFDPDAYGSYWDYWSPINPNFYTDYVRIPIAKTATLKGHPKFEVFRKMAEDAFRSDVFHSVTLPGGAGQECPGYTAHAMQSWKMLAPVARKHLGFDPMKWPRVKAAASFLLHTSQPLGGGKRRILPLGDTHPTGPDVVKLAREFGAYEDVRKFRTEELPGFGVVFRSHPGTDRENFLAFKSGPNRGHNHGDQLSFHYCADGRQAAIDHMCSYSPRADQEHMHNRVAFSAGDFKYANMDGYERVLAFKTSDTEDVAVGQVRSRRLRKQPKLPQDIKWDPIGPYLRFKKPLIYRRTVVMIKDPKGKAKDYFVVRDQHWGPKVTATYGLHVLTGKLDRKGNRVNFGNMTLFLASPAKPDYERFDWSYSKGRGGFGEKTLGVRFSVTGENTQFISVLYPGGHAPRMEAIPNGVRVKFADGSVDEIAFGDEPKEGSKKAPLVIVKRGGKAETLLTAGELDFKRSQGEVGLFVPDCGYDFGPIPDWLREQRTFGRKKVLGK
ncbi:MAG: hypothetical protein ACLFVY_09100 [Phycisphaerae bacterium]